jgi:hypothetical protein
MKYEPQVGEDFPVDAVSIAASANLLREVTRSALAMTVVGGSAVALVLAAGWSIVSGSSGALTTVWAIVAAPIGCVVGYYFNSRQTTHGHGDKA